MSARWISGNVPSSRSRPCSRSVRRQWPRTPAPSRAIVIARYKASATASASNCGNSPRQASSSRIAFPTAAHTSGSAMSPRTPSRHAVLLGDSPASISGAFPVSMLLTEVEQQLIKLRWSNPPHWLALGPDLEQRRGAVVQRLRSLSLW